MKAAKAASKALGEKSSKPSIKVKTDKKSSQDFDKLIAGDFDIKKADRSIADLTNYWKTAKAGIAKSKQFKEQVMKKITQASKETSGFLTKISKKLNGSGKTAAPAKATAPAKKEAAAPAKAAAPTKAPAKAAAAPAKKLRRLITKY